MAPRFSKTDLLREVRNLYYLYARALNVVFGPDEAYRSVGWEPPTDSAFGPLLDPSFLDFDDLAEAEGRDDTLERLPAAQVFDQLYDYAVFGIRRSDMEPLEPTTMPAFFAAWVNDVCGSDLIHELHNCETLPDFGLVRQTINLAEARSVLDGNRRFRTVIDAPGDGFLSFAEVALLAGIDERSVRNAASKKGGDLIATPSSDERRSFIRVEDARAWLKGRRGFVPSTRDGIFARFDLLAQSFDDISTVRAFLRFHAESNLLSVDGYLRLLPAHGRSEDIDWANTPLPSDHDEARAVAAALAIDADALFYRLEELRTAQALAAIRGKLQALTEGVRHDR
jgi:hypothetical protein